MSTNSSTEVLLSGKAIIYNTAQQKFFLLFVKDLLTCIGYSGGAESKYDINFDKMTLIFEVLITPHIMILLQYPVRFYTSNFQTTS